MGSSLVNVKSERQACRLEPQAGADPDLEAEFLPPPGSLRFCSKGLWLTGWGNHSVEGDLLCLTSDDRCELHPQTTLRQHLDKCLVESLETGSAKLTPELTISVPVKLFALKNPNICTVITAFHSLLGFALKYIIFGEQSLLGKSRFLLKILNLKRPSSDLWSSGVWGLAQTWARRTVSMFWSLSIPNSSERGVRLSDVSVWVTVVSWSRLPMSCRTGGLQTGEWFLVWPKVLWSLHEASLFHQSHGERWD